MRSSRRKYWPVCTKNRKSINESMQRQALVMKILFSFSIFRSDDEPEVYTNVNQTVVFQSEREKPGSEDATKQPDAEKKKKKKGNKAVPENSSASHDSTEVASTSAVPVKPDKSVPIDAVADDAPKNTTEEVVGKDAKSEKVPNQVSQQKQQMVKPEPKVKPESKAKPEQKSKPEPNTKPESKVKVQPKAKAKPKVQLIKPAPSAGASKFGKIKFDKNFVKKPQSNAKNANGLTDERLKAFGINPRRYNWKLKHGNSNNTNQTQKQNSNKRPNHNNKFTSPKGQSAPPNKKRKI